ncbi:DUF5995 family protein [Micromonosporaceae bacterium DT194]|uniref:DUF5995 family protein n=1 Tax=Melissospora conviva TaxID=3388432 RepID=UPI003C1A2187
MRTASRLCAATVGLALLASPAVANANPATAPTTGAPTCVVQSTQSEQQRLVALTDVGTLAGIEDARARVVEINELLAARGDNRGTFSLVYKEILDKTIPALTDGTFRDPRWARNLSVDFVTRYLENFHAHLTGGTPTPYWQSFFDLAADCDRSPARVVGEGISTHLVVDFPDSLIAVDTRTRHLRDYTVYGEALVEAAPGIVERMREYYGVDMQPFFQLWLVGEVFGETTATTGLFQSVRAVAWTNAVGLRLHERHARTKIDRTWRAAGVVLDGLEKTGKI